MFRAHQDAFGQFCQDLAAGQVSGVRSVICSITPGGGKSLLPVIAAKVLLPCVADRIAWVVPRKSLQEQAEAEFATGRSRQMLGHKHLIRKTTGEPDPCRGLAGFVTTYQAIGANNYFLKDEFGLRRYVLILDEPHHVEEGGAWERALAPLVKRAALTVFMSGTLERGSNRERIAFLTYTERPEGDVVDMSGRGGAVIRYSRADALFDKAIIPIHFELMDGTATWLGRDGEQYSTLLSAAHKDTNEAIYTALKTQFAVHLLEACTEHWLSYQATHDRSKLLVVTANIEDAKKYLDILQERGLHTAIATSDDSALAAANIKNFKKTSGAGRLDCLVTVAMAYEGLDVPAVTHIACLTHIRSKPWIEQMIARATRFDPHAGPWEEQMAYIYVPDDRLMGNIIGRMQEEQFIAVKARMERDEDEAQERLESEPGERSYITPLGSEGLTTRWNRVGRVDERAATLAAMEERTPSQMEAELREKIQNHCKSVDALFFDRQWGETNKRVVRIFGQSRLNMPLDVLQKVMVWLEEMYPITVGPRK